MLRDRITGASLALCIAALVLLILITRHDFSPPTFSHTLRFTQTNLLNRTVFIVIPVTREQWRDLTNKYPANVVAGEVSFK